VNQSPTFGWPLALALAVLLAMAIGAARSGRLLIERAIVTAGIRALVQLVAVSGVIALVLDRVWASLVFSVLMFATATATGAGRIGARRDWAWVGLALATGVIPVLAVIFGFGAAAFTGPGIIPIAGIIIGGSMTAHTLTARRAFDALRSERGTVEARLALGFLRPAAIAMVIARHAPEALTPVLDQTRTVGLVTLPGAFVGVILGGGSASEAAATQVLVLVGLLAAETLVVIGSQRLIAADRIMAPDLRESLPRD
jgi:putative ABC transport system permease protein